MATITLNINEKSKAGQIFMAFLKQFILNNDKSIEVVKSLSEETLKSIKNIEAGKGLTSTTSHSDLMEKLNS